ncbi:MAG: hypothetical protein JJ892_03975 [Balneola sp.]|nr:hypothetical protein [Balneola sp.]MBO6651605.1 hypothetical protein [Balneola sp.]MBO6710729.1 hypothetical protein [Balneola sp.]MBO6799415.1 hypothetical protein [Balneola sp.]MBO6869456.1 hypothetical protein [Balneola sp.]
MKKLLSLFTFLLAISFTDSLLGQYSKSITTVKYKDYNNLDAYSFYNDLNYSEVYSVNLKDDLKSDLILLHPEKEDIILNKLDIPGHVYAKNSNDIYRPANNRNGSIQSAFGMRDTLHLSNIRESSLVTLRIEYDSVEVASNYTQRPKFMPGTDGLYPQKESYFYDRPHPESKTLYVIELVFMNRQEMKFEMEDDVHIHGHICDPSKPGCNS